VSSADDAATDSHSELTVFDDASSQLPWAEVERARGIALMTTAWNKRDEHLAAAALAHLLETFRGDLSGHLATIDDMPLLDELAAGYLLLRNFDLAGACWRRMLELDPNSETALMGIAKVAEEDQDLQVLGEALDRLLKLNPSSAQALELLVKQRHYSQDLPGAIEAAERALGIDPTRTELRSWLVGAYRQQENADKAKEHEEFLQKMEGAKRDAASGSAN